MITNAQNNTVFGATYKKGDILHARHGVKNFLYKINPEAKLGLDMFIKEHNMKKTIKPPFIIDAKMNLIQRSKDFFFYLYPKNFYSNIVEAFIRPAPDCSSGKPTFALKIYRNVAGYNIGHSTQEIPIEAEDSANKILEALNNAYNKSVGIADNAHDEFAKNNNKEFARALNSTEG